ncbi:MAG: alginate lyase family protein, partial [Bacteroidales bacterium]|nr:alginate lyase family protein [Bacteroidales bacterium]
RSDEIVTARSGIRMKTFGAPYNAVDENTAKALVATGNFTHVFFAPAKYFEGTGIVVLNNRVNLENGTGNVEFAYLKKNFEASKYTDFIVLQGHPNGWRDQKIKEFSQVLDYLLSQGCTFILPQEITGADPELIRANSLLYAPDVTIVNKKAVPPSGDKHDYVSMGPYWWPDPSKPDGKPYIRKDGQINPERENYTDRANFGKMSSSVQALARTYAKTGDEKYAQRAVKFLNTFFLNPETKMNPHIEYGQFIPGITNGRAEGIIETASVPALIKAMSTLQKSKSWTADLDKGMKQWMSDYYKWLTTSKIGLDEQHAKNNHGTYYDSQCLAILPWLGRTKEAKQYYKKITLPRLVAQIPPDGSQPKELARTKAFSYSVMNLNGFVRIAGLAEELGLDLWHYKKHGQVYLKSMIDWFIPYLTKEKEFTWPQIERTSVRELVPTLNQAAEKYNDPSYRQVIEKLQPLSDTIVL